MKLFKQCTSYSEKYSGYSEPEYSFLCRTDRPEMVKAKELLEKWFLSYPTSQKNELRSRFQSNDNLHHQGAFFELFYHQMLINLGYSVEIHPSIKDSPYRPDFIVGSAILPKFYFEATVAACKPTIERVSQARINAVYDVINRQVISNDFALLTNNQGFPKTPPQATEIAKKINQQLEMLDYEKIKYYFENNLVDEIPRWVFTHDDWILEVSPFPCRELKRKRKTRIIAGTSEDINFQGQIKSISESIKKKGNKYKNLEFPLVIAINSYENIDKEEMINSLFGENKLTYSLPIENEEIQYIYRRHPNGIFGNEKQPKYSRISAVLFVNALRPWNICHVEMLLFINPWAQYPLKSQLEDIPKGYFSNGNLFITNGLTTSKIFNLPNNWPNIETT